MIRTLAAAAVMLTMFSAPVLAQETDPNAELIAIQVMGGCIEFDDADKALGAEAEFKIVLKDDGYPESAEIVSYMPEDDNGKRIADAILTGVNDCGPYLADGGEYTFKMWPGMPTE